MRSYKCVELTTNLPCPVGCVKYCPQERLAKAYGDRQRLMDDSTFYNVLAKVPSETQFNFCGLSEPLLNPNCIRWIETSLSAGFKTQLFTTLTGTTEEDIERLVAIVGKLDLVCLHIPDGANYKTHDPNYSVKLLKLLNTGANILFSHMNKGFVSIKREMFERDIKVHDRKLHPYCSKINEIGWNILPDGGVQLCSMDFNLTCPIGNINTHSIDELLKHQREMKLQDSYICQQCSRAFSLRKYLFFRFSDWARGKYYGEKHLQGLLGENEREGSWSYQRRIISE